jgi:hypothetical protein
VIRGSLNGLREATMKLNERTRARFRELAIEAESDRDVLSHAAIERMANATIAHAKQSAYRRNVIRVVGAMAIAASVFVFAQRNAAAPEEPMVANDPPPAPRCTAFATTGATTIDAAASSRTDIHDRARIDFAAGTHATVDASAHCASRVVLTNGSVAVWARDLGGGSLAVEVGATRVTVHGTVFEVRAELDGSAYVAVREGRVRVLATNGSRWLVGNQAARIDATGHVLDAALDASAEARLLAVHSGNAPAAELAMAVAPSTTPTLNAPVPTVAPASADEPVVDPAASLRQAEIAYRAGNPDEARRLFRRVGATRGPLAEAAWIRLGRLEMRAGRTAEAARALGEHRRRFPAGSLAAEARVAEAQALRALGRGAEAEALERWVVDNRPDSPYATAIRERAH